MNSVPFGKIPFSLTISSSATDTSGFHSLPLLPCAAANTECRYFLANRFQIFWVNTQKEDWWIRSGFCFLFLEEVLCGGPDAAAHFQRQGRLGQVQSRGEWDRQKIKDKERGSEVERKGLASRGLKVRKEPLPPHIHPNSHVSKGWSHSVGKKLCCFSHLISFKPQASVRPSKAFQIRQMVLSRIQWKCSQPYRLA